MVSNNFQCLNSSKTEAMLLSSPHQLRNAGSVDLSVDGVALELTCTIHLTTLSFEPCVQSTLKTSFFHLRNIARIRPMLSFSAQ